MTSYRGMVEKQAGFTKQSDRFRLEERAKESRLQDLLEGAETKAFSGARELLAR